MCGMRKIMGDGCGTDTVDGRNPAPLGMYKNLVNHVNH